MKLTPAQLEANIAGAWAAAEFMARQGRLYSWEASDRAALAEDRASSYVASLGYTAQYSADLAHQFKAGFLGVAALLLGEVECKCSRRVP